MIKLYKGAICQYPDCTEDATAIAQGRDDPELAEPNLYCEAHALLVESDGYPEYQTKCPNCGCRFGVN